MNRVLTSTACILAILFAPLAGQAQWSEGQEGQLVIRGGWLFDGVRDERRPNSGIVIRDGRIVEVDADLGQQVLGAADVIDPADLLRSAEGKIGPAGPADRADWELELRPLKRD